MKQHWSMLEHLLSVVVSRKAAGWPSEFNSGPVVPLTTCTVMFVALAVLLMNGSSWGSAGEVHARMVPATTAPIQAGMKKS